MLKCSRCKNLKNECKFNKDRSKKRGYSSYCKVCKKERELETRYSINERRREYYHKNKERILKLQMMDRIKNADKYREREALRSESKKEYRMKNKEALTKKAKIYRTTNQSDYNYREAKRRATKIQATPYWSELNEIKVLYKKVKWLESLTGLKYHVDHVIPLKGENVCGLHVWANLQILEEKLNISKGNRL